MTVISEAVSGLQPEISSTSADGLISQLAGFQGLAA
jgi:hypothetical protein